MSEPSKIVEEILASLRSFPLYMRITVLICLLIPLAVALNGLKGWPNWPSHFVGLNILGFAGLTAALLVIILYTPRPAMSVSELPETKPVFADALKYFKTGPKLEGSRGELLKGLQNEYETAAIPNSHALSESEMDKCRTSPWEFDRIAFYLFERYQRKPSPDERIQRVRHEIRLLDSRGWTGTLVPLHYAVESVYPGLFERKPGPTLSTGQLQPFTTILEKLDSWPARLNRWFGGQGGRNIIRNCRMLLTACG